MGALEGAVRCRKGIGMDGIMMYLEMPRHQAPLELMELYLQQDGRSIRGSMQWASLNTAQLALVQDFMISMACLRVTRCSPLQFPQMGQVCGLKRTASAAKKKDSEPMTVSQRAKDGLVRVFSYEWWKLMLEAWFCSCQAVMQAMGESVSS